MLFTIRIYLNMEVGQKKLKANVGKQNQNNQKY